MSRLSQCLYFPLLFCLPLTLLAQVEPHPDLAGMSSSRDVETLVAAEGEGAGQAETSTFLWPEKYAAEFVIGLNGFGLYGAKPFSRHVTMRLGGNFITYTHMFPETDATVYGTLRFAYGKATLDYFPNGGNGRFHISPLLVFANNTRAHATVGIDPAQEIDFGGDSYVSSPADPLHGTGQVDFAKTAPGLAVGWGNLTHGRGHWAFPVEVGFFYVGQPKLAIGLSGSACDISHPEYGCTPITQNPDYQKNLAVFLARQNHNLSYAKFLPMLNFGVGYRF